MQNLDVLLASVFRTVFPQVSVAFNKTLNWREKKKKTVEKKNLSSFPRQTDLCSDQSLAVQFLWLGVGCSYFCWHKRKKNEPAFQSVRDGWCLVVSAVPRVTCLPKMGNTKKLLLMRYPHRPYPAQRKLHPLSARLNLCGLAAIVQRK